MMSGPPEALKEIQEPIIKFCSEWSLVNDNIKEIRFKRKV